MTSDTLCSRCGSREATGSRFCGECGAPLHQPAREQEPSSASLQRRSTMTEPSHWRGLPYGLVIGFGIATLLLGVTLCGALSLLTEDSPRERNRTSSRDSSGTPTDSSGDDDAAPTSTRRHDDSSRLARAREVDRSADFPYSSRQVTCAARPIADLTKDIGAEIDKELRRVNRISVKEEKELGEDVLRALKRELGGQLLSSGPVADYLTAVAAPLVAQASRKEIEYRFYYAKGTRVENALALPGGHIIVTEPFLNNFIKNEAQLAIILGHEIGHVEKRHPLAVLQYSRTLGLPEDDAISQTAVKLITTPYNSRQEEDSDEYGARLAHTGDYSLFEGVALWEAQAKGKKGSGSVLDEVMDEAEDILSSHPRATRRACMMKRFAYKEHKRAPKKIVYVGTTNLKRKIPMSEETY